MASEMILKRMQIMDDLKKEINKIKELYEESLESDAQYQEVQEETSKITEEVREKKEKILSNSSYKDLADQIKELQSQLKENKEALSMELVEYYKDSGDIQIEDHEGNIKRMQFSVKLVNF